LAGWLLEPGITYLDHGAHGACTRRVFETYQTWQRELEGNPTRLFSRRLDGLLSDVRGALGAFVGADPADLALVPNATTGLNAAIRALRLGPDDEVLTTAHEYGALVKAWEFVGARLVVREPEELTAAIGRRTRARVPQPPDVADGTRAARRGCLSRSTAGRCALDRRRGARARTRPGRPGIPRRHVYAGNCHKWMCAPKGSAFLWARAEHQSWIEPVVTSWGWPPGAAFPEKHEWQGTFDPAAWLTVPAAIEAWHGLDLDGCRELAARGRERLPPIGDLPAPQMW
jgi:isopenicillin-N epimerase